MRSLLTLCCASATLVACGVSLDARTEGEALAIESVAPDFGPVGGGTVVQLLGSGFDPSAQVYFGSARLDVDFVDTGLIEVVTPDAGGPLTVDVRLRQGAEEVVVAGGFTFTDGGDPDPDPDPGGGGRVAGYAELTRLQVACPACLGTADILVSAGAVFHAPVAGSWEQNLPASGQCVVNPSGGLATGPGLDVGSAVQLRLGATQVALPRVSAAQGYQYSAPSLTLGDYVANGSYDLSAPGTSGGAIQLQGALRGADGFASITPVEMLYTQPEAAFQAVFSSASGGRVTWSPAGSGTGFLVAIEAFDAWSGAPLGRTLICHGPDNGLMNISGGQIAQLTGGQEALATVGLYRRLRVTQPFPGGSALFEGVTMSGVLGTASLY